MSETVVRPVLGALLAGGQSRRYGGEPKALVTVAGQTIAERAIRALKAATYRVVIVANEPEHYHPLGLEIRSDLRPGLGALGGIHTAVAWAHESGCRGALVAACDMPFLSPRLLQHLVEGSRANEVVAPASESRRGLEPLCAYYGVECRFAIEAALDQGHRHVTSFFPQVQVRTLPAEAVARYGDPELLFLNVNTQEDRERAEAAARTMEAAGR